MKGSKFYFLVIALSSGFGSAFVTSFLIYAFKPQIWEKIIQPVYAAGSTAIVLTKEASCPPGFTDVTPTTGRLLMADSAVSGSISNGGALNGGPGNTDLHALTVNEMPVHNHQVSTSTQLLQTGSNAGHPGSGGTGWFSDNSGGGQAHSHSLPYAGFRLCEWNVN